MYSMKNRVSYDSNMVCSNCSCLGHTSKFCPQPITSYGVIVFRVLEPWNQAAALLQQDRQIFFTGLEQIQDQIQFLMIQRRDSIGFVEMMRGKYRVTDTEYIMKHLSGMTNDERKRLVEEPFDELWENLWGPTLHTNHAYKYEREQAKQKLEALRSASPSLKDMVECCVTTWDTPEWGFPKGRRDMNESEYACAMRELWEETNIEERDIIPIRNLESITEKFFGSNQVHYSHKYYIAYAPPEIAQKVTYEWAVGANKHVQREVGNIKWMHVKDALNAIRPDNFEKKEILLRVCSLLRNYCPLRLPA